MIFFMKCFTEIINTLLAYLHFDSTGGTANWFHIFSGTEAAQPIHIYRVLSPERAILSIAQGPDGNWEIQQLYLACNVSVSAETRFLLKAGSKTTHCRFSQRGLGTRNLLPWAGDVKFMNRLTNSTKRKLMRLTTVARGRLLENS